MLGHAALAQMNLTPARAGTDGFVTPRYRPPRRSCLSPSAHHQGEADRFSILVGLYSFGEVSSMGNGECWRLLTHDLIHRLAAVDKSRHLLQALNRLRL